MIRICFFMLLFGCSGMISAQPFQYTSENLHSHNDYEKPSPFWEAYGQEYGSIEADIFLEAGSLIIAHDTVQLKKGRTLDSFYLERLQQGIKKNNGFPYAEHDKVLQLLIDIKTDSVATLDALVKKLKNYPAITGCNAVKIVITGNRPAIFTFKTYPAWIRFDGELSADYPPTAMDKIEMLSDNFRKYSKWNGIDTLATADKALIESVIQKAHKLHKKVRFWNAPDLISSWKVFMSLGVDYINTDHITAAAIFLKESGGGSK